MYQLTSDPSVIKRIADGAFVPADEANADYAKFLAWCSQGNEPTPAPQADVRVSMVALVQAKLDTAAQALGYDDLKTAVTYADEPAVPKFQAEGRALRAWRSLVWAECYVVLAEVEAGAPVPTPEALLDRLPALELP